MKKVIAVISMVVAVTILSSCSARLYEEEKTDPYYNTIHRGMMTHNQLVLSNQHEQLMKMDEKILENQEKILANQKEIIQLLEVQK